MTGVVDLEINETGENGAVGSPVKDTWVLRLPKETCDREGFAEGTMVSLTIKNGELRSSFILPNKLAKESANRFINKYRDFMTEMEKVD